MNPPLRHVRLIAAALLLVPWLVPEALSPAPQFATARLPVAVGSAFVGLILMAIAVVLAWLAVAMGSRERLAAPLALGGAVLVLVSALLPGALLLAGPTAAAAGIVALGAIAARFVAGRSPASRLALPLTLVAPAACATVVVYGLLTGRLPPGLLAPLTACAALAGAALLLLPPARK